MNDLSKHKYFKMPKKKNKGYSNISNDEIYKIAGLIKKKPKKKLIETNKQLIQSTLNQKSRKFFFNS